MKNVIILNTTHFANKGSMGRIEGMIRCLDETIPDSKITFLHRYYKHDKDTLAKQLLKKYPNIEVKEHPWYRESSTNTSTVMFSIVRLCSSIIGHRLFHKMDPSLKCDAIVDLNLIEPDKFTSEFSLASFIGNVFTLLNIWHAKKVAGTPVMVCSATIGPYYNKILKRLAKHILNNVDLITLREGYSKGSLQSLGVNGPPIYVTADLAFLLEPTNDDKTSAMLENIDDGHLIGLVPTEMMHPSLKQSQYIRLMTELSNHLINNLNATIIYVSHTYQDELITQNIYQNIENKHKVRIVPSDLSASETKGIIGMCSLFICSRFHALVASTSLAIPSLGIVAYSKNKFHGIIGEMMGQENYLLDIDDDFEYDAFLLELKSKINDLTMNQESIIKELNEKAKIAREQTLRNGKLLSDIIDSSSPR